MPAELPDQMLWISSAAMAAVAAHALADDPREAVGLLGRADALGPLVAHHPLVNERDERATTGFLVHPQPYAAAVRALQEAGLQLGALYHSHTSSRAGQSSAGYSTAMYSTVDCRHAALGLPQLIVAVRGGAVVEARAWLPRADRKSMDELVLGVLSEAGSR